jgi:hypothetical protein
VLRPWASVVLAPGTRVTSHSSSCRPRWRPCQLPSSASSGSRAATPPISCARMRESGAALHRMPTVRQSGERVRQRASSAVRTCPLPLPGSDQPSRHVRDTYSWATTRSPCAARPQASGANACAAWAGAACTRCPMRASARPLCRAPRPRAATPPAPLDPTSCLAALLPVYNIGATDQDRSGECKCGCSNIYENKYEFLLMQAARWAWTAPWESRLEGTSRGAARPAHP